jgi:hypothetical protein
VVLDEKMKLEAEYDIMNFCNFPEGLEWKVKVGKISPYAPHDQQLSLCDEMIEWPQELQRWVGSNHNVLNYIKL